MKFYETNWFLWLTLILCAPIGIFVLWRFHAEETTRLKMIMSIIFLALFIGVIALGVHFVKGDDHRAQDQKPAKETTEEDTGDEIEEEIGSLAFVFSPNNVTVVGNEAKNVIVSNVDEREEVVWSIDDPDIAYIESAVGNSCMIVGVGEGETVLKAHSSSGSGEIAITVKEGVKGKEASAEKKITAALDKSALEMGSNFQYNLETSKDLSSVTLDFWIEGFSAEYVDETGGDKYNLKAMKKKSQDYTEMLRDAVDKAGGNAGSATITVNFRNGTYGDSYYNDVNECDVTNDIVFSFVNGEEVTVPNN